MTDAPKPVTLNRQVMLHRMHELGLSQRAVGRLTGLPISVIAAVI